MSATVNFTCRMHQNVEEVDNSILIEETKEANDLLAHAQTELESVCHAYD